MESPLQITFHQLDSSPALEQAIRQQVDELERFCDRIISCRVVVERRDLRHVHGNLFDVRVDLTVPGREIVVGRDSRRNQANEDPYVAVRDAFHAARRRLEDYARTQRGDVKLHAVPDHGRVARLLPERDCGFIETPAGEEIYFHRNSVAEANFDDLEVGAEVRYVARHDESAAGPQASTVVPLGKRRLPPTEEVRS